MIFFRDRVRSIRTVVTASHQRTGYSEVWDKDVFPVHVGRCCQHTDRYQAGLDSQPSYHTTRRRRSVTQQRLAPTCSDDHSTFGTHAHLLLSRSST